MPIDASIPLQVQAPANPLAQYAQLAQLQNMQTQGKLADIQVQGAQRAQERQNKLSQLLSGDYATPDAREQALLRGGFADESLKLGKDRRENTKTDLGNEESRQKLFKGGLNLIATNPTPETVNAVLDHLEQQTGKPAGPAKQIFAQAKTPEQIAEFAKRMGIELEKQLPTFQSRNTGGSTDTLSIDPVTGKVAVANSVQNTQSPDNKASVGASYANASATREVAKATRDAASINAGYGREQDLRKEFQSLPEVKNYKHAIPAFKGIEDAIKRDTPQSDINIVYGIAKLYDPTSVVREGEYATVANSPNIPDRIKGYANYLAGGGRLTKKVKDEIYAEARSRMQSFEGEYQGARGDFESIASRSGSDPTRIFPRPDVPVVTDKANTAQPAGTSKGFKVIRD